MDRIVDDMSLAIGQRITLERETRGWSMAELATRSGVSKAAISKIERHETSPTAALLMKLAAAFDLTLAGLLLRIEGQSGQVSRKTDQPTWQDPETGYQRRQLFLRADHPIELVSVELPPGRSVSLPASSFARIREVLLVTTGKLTVVDPLQRHELEAGDCVGFGPPADTVFANESDRPCTYLVALARS